MLQAYVDQVSELGLHMAEFTVIFVLTDILHEHFGKQIDTNTMMVYLTDSMYRNGTLAQEFCPTDIDAAALQIHCTSEELTQLNTMYYDIFYAHLVRLFAWLGKYNFRQYAGEVVSVQLDKIQSYWDESWRGQK